jgi:polyisoprenoid-binding protein YceI
MDPIQVTTESTATWTIDPQYTIAQFRVKSLFFFTVSGSFAGVKGTLLLDESDINIWSVDAVVNAAAINTGIARRDAHLRSKDFLDTAEYHEIRFRSTLVERGTDRDMLRIRGVLTIKGKSREVLFDVTEVDHSRSPSGEDVAYYSAATTINRHDFGVSHLRGIIAASIALRIHVQAVKQP